MNNFSDLVELIDQSLLGRSVKRMAEREELKKRNVSQRCAGKLSNTTGWRVNGRRS